MQTQIIKIGDSLNDDDIIKLSSCAEIIKSGGLVVFPTETVYGLGADATNPTAAEKIYAAKGRPSDNPLIVHVYEANQADKYAYTNPIYYRLAEAFMPGPITVVLKSRETIPSKTRGGLDTVAIRCPEALIARELIKLSSVPIAAPSANISGSPSPTSVKHVIHDMNGRVDAIIDGGDSDFGLESTIVKVNDDDSVTLLRPGKITVDDISGLGIEVRIADAVTNELKKGEVALSPGMKYKHYAPKADLILVDGNFNNLVDIVNNLNKNVAVISYDEDISFFENKKINADLFSFGKIDDLKQQAHSLFYLLRELDLKDYDVIYAPLPEKKGIGLALYNRMIRAAAHNIIKL